MAKVQGGVEILPKISTAWVRAHERYRRQTDGRTTAYSERDREFTLANTLQEVRLLYVSIHTGSMQAAFPTSKAARI